MKGTRVSLRLTDSEAAALEKIREEYFLDTVTGAVSVCIRSRPEYIPNAEEKKKEE